jgi:hypothetical protein
VVALNMDGLELVVKTGKTRFDNPTVSDDLLGLLTNKDQLPELFQWGDDYLILLQDETTSMEDKLVGVMGISKVGSEIPDEEQLAALKLLSHRAALSLRDRRNQTQVFQSLANLTPQVDLIQRMRAAGRFDESSLLVEGEPSSSQNVAQWVKDALAHYWGGPKLTESPLMQLQIVQESLKEHEGNYANALRSILKDAIEKVRPEGDRRFTAEWILYNIIEMKFVEGRRVREIASRLAMSEADLYRKQRIAIEAVARNILEMENQAKNQDIKTMLKP